MSNPDTVALAVHVYESAGIATERCPPGRCVPGQVAPVTAYSLSSVARFGSAIDNPLGTAIVRLANTYCIQLCCLYVKDMSSVVEY